MEQNFNDTYTIDLSYTVSASDIVYELSSILDNDRAKNQKIALKLGKVDLNQSQLLSIRSLINSINSTVEYLETDSTQTELAAINLGIIVSTVKNVEVEKTELEEPTYVQSYGYIKLEDHIEEDEEEEKEKKVKELKEEVAIEDFACKAGIVEETAKDEEKEEESAEILSEEIIMTEEDIALKEKMDIAVELIEEQAEEILESKTEDIQEAYPRPLSLP